MIPVLVVQFAAVLFAATFGFGDALLAMPILAAMLGPQVAAPVVAGASLVLAILVVARERGAAAWDEVRRLLLAAALGVPVGVVSLRFLPAAGILSVLGALLVLYGAWGALAPAPRGTLAAGWGWGFGLVAGFLGGATATSGPPIVAYSAARGWPPTRARASMQAFFLLADGLVIGGQAAAGLWTVEVVRLVGYAVPGVIVAAVLGTSLNRRIPAVAFRRVIHGGLALLGIGLLASLA